MICFLKTTNRSKMWINNKKSKNILKKKAKTSWAAVWRTSAFLKSRLAQSSQVTLALSSAANRLIKTITSPKKRLTACGPRMRKASCAMANYFENTHRLEFWSQRRNFRANNRPSLQIRNWFIFEKPSSNHRFPLHEDTRKHAFTKASPIPPSPTALPEMRRIFSRKKNSACKKSKNSAVSLINLRHFLSRHSPLKSLKQNKRRTCKRTTQLKRIRIQLRRCLSWKDQTESTRQVCHRHQEKFCFQISRQAKTL